MSDPSAFDAPLSRFLTTAPAAPKANAVSASAAPRNPTPANRPAPLIVASDLRKSYRKANIEIPVLKGVDLEIHRNEFLAIIGQSGSGKSTLLHLLATLDAPDAGTIQFEGNRIDNLPSRGRDILRNKYFGMIFQFYHLLPELTALENVLAPLLIAESWLGYMRRRSEHRRRAIELLDLVGLAHRQKHRPRELSGGEMQRTAIARALISNPRVLLADEPTGNLDRATGEGILEILGRLNRDENLTIVMVTHDGRIAAQADRTVELVEGRTVLASGTTQENGPDSAAA